MIDVMNLSTGDVFTYDTDSPKRAIFLCYQQITQKNFNTWDYTFDQQIDESESELCYFIGDLAVFKDGRRIE